MSRQIGRREAATRVAVDRAGDAAWLRRRRVEPVTPDPDGNRAQRRLARRSQHPTDGDPETGRP